MHERNERALCRLAFLLLCALPTCLTLGVAFWTRTSWYHQRQIVVMEGKLQQLLGFGVTIGDMSRPTPHAWQLDDVVLSDPETRAEVARVRNVSFAVVQERIRLHMAQPEFRAAHLGSVWRTLHDRLLCQPEILGAGMDVMAEDLSVHSVVQGVTVTPVRVWVDSAPVRTRAIMQFKLAGSGSDDEPAVLRVERTRGNEAPRTVWTLQTGSAPLPCSVLADYLPVMRRLGIQAEFSGILHWEAGMAGHREDYSVRLEQARFAKVNLAELLEPFDYRMSGLGDIEIHELVRYRGLPIGRATGSLVVEESKVDSEILRRMGSLLGVHVGAVPSEPGTRIACQLISLQFQLNGQQLQLLGTGYRQPGFEYLEPGVAVVAGQMPLVRIDPRQRMPIDQMTRVVDPQQRMALPVGVERHWANGLLPPLAGITEDAGGNEGRAATPATAEVPPLVRGLRIEGQR